MHRLAPSRHAPALLTARATLLQIRKLPQVVDSVEIADLDKPGSHA